MKQALVILAALSLIPGAASAQPTKSDVLMQVRSNGVPSLTKCGLDGFVAAPTPPQPETGATLCAIGGPFGAGMVGVLVPPTPKFAGHSGTIQLDRTFNFNNGTADALTIRTIVHATAQIRPGTGGINYFEGSWEITGGTGLFAGQQGQGTVTVALGSHAPGGPPPPQFGREELVGWVTK
jgi:hypothetical protein